MKYLFFSLIFAFGLQVFAEHPCQKDIEAHCAKTKKGHGRILKCLRENEEKLSAECKASMEEKKEQMKEVRKACEEDRKTLCPGLKRKELKKCMNEKKEQVSESCKKEWQELKAKKKGAEH